MGYLLDIIATCKFMLQQLLRNMGNLQEMTIFSANISHPIQEIFDKVRGFNYTNCGIKAGELLLDVDRSRKLPQQYYFLWQLESTIQHRQDSKS